MADAADAGFPLTVQQRRLWEAGAASADHLRVLRLTGPLDQERLQAAIRGVVERHEALRTTFSRLPGMRLPLAVIGEGPEVGWEVLQAGSDRDAACAGVMAELERAPFEPDSGPALRAWLIALDPERHDLVLAVPALCADDRSLDVIAADLGRAYGGSPDADDPVQYADFGGWQEGLAEDEAAGEALAFWRERAAAVPPARLPFAGGAASEGPARHRSVAAHEPQLADALSDAAQRLAAEPADVLAACWHAVLWRFDQPGGVGVGHLLDGRPFEGLEPAVGPYAQTVPVLSRPEPGLPFAQLVAQLAGQAAAARERQQFFGVSELPPGAGRPLPWQFAWRVAQPLEAWDGVAVETAGDWPAGEPHDVRLSGRALGDDLELTLSHDPARVGEQDAQSLLGWTVQALHAALEDPETAVDRLPLLDAEARREALRRRSLAADPPAAATLHEAIEEQARHAPEAVAVEFADHSVTYGELVGGARALAARLSEYQVGLDERVGICLERGPGYVTALLAAMMAGGCYVPLDPDYPPAYVGRIVADADARVVITQEALRGGLEGIGVPLLSLDAPDQPLPAAAGDFGDVAAGPDNLAYAIYTSGSTGEPKGVEVTHRSALALAGALRATVYAGESGPLRVTVNAPFTFDASVKQIVQLTYGDTLHVLPADIRLDAHALSDHLEHRQVDVLDCTPSQLRPLLHAIEIHEGRERPRIVLVGGEAIGADLWAALREREGMAAWNVYGPTETTVDATAARVDDSGEEPTIGRPLPGVQALVLDAALQPVPAGVLGELCIGGWGVARGYIGAPEATAEGFVEHPESESPGERLFRTGDLARLRPEGTLDFVGRRDRQVKLRGFRVGLPEIEAALARHPGVAEAAVVDVTMRTGATRLAAFVVAAGDEGDGLAQSLEAHAESQLPEHMRPASHAVMDALPTTAHAKVDLQRLRELAAERLDSGGTPVPPRNDTERTLAEIWSAALETDRVGIHDNFFDLGGDSILQIVVVARAKERGLDLSPRDLYERPTIAELAQVGSGAAQTAGR